MKYFVVSDVHGFFKAMKAALNEAGFENGNPEHKLIVCGDLLDRGLQAKEMVAYMRDCPNKILIRGNHEDLFEECCDRQQFWSHDISNGTADTICQLAGKDDPFNVNEKDFIKAHAIFSVLLDQMVDYYETENYIFVHGWIPDVGDYKDFYGIDWRKYPANGRAWKEARWRNGMLAAATGDIVKDKTIVSGHWHCSWGHATFDEDSPPEWGSDAVFTPYYSKGIIAIDACTAYSGFVNCLVLED